MTRGPRMEVVQLHPLRAAPFSCCFFCRHVMKEGEEVSTVTIALPIRYGKQRKKLKGNTDRTHLAHADCPR